MVSQKEIIRLSKQFDVAPEVIDKDWVLGHLLNAFYSVGNNKELFVFKGGTCLKKCYFDDYRFSEDLDFTLVEKDFLINKTFINKITKKATDNSNIVFSFESIKEQIHNDIQQGYEVKIKYWGANHKPNSPIPLPSRWQTYIKLDISFSEELFDRVDNRQILHNYSDSELISETIPSYSMLEIISEKLRALIQRNRPRDIYDIWYIMNSNTTLNLLDIKDLLIKKANSKDIEIVGIEQFINDEKLRKNKRAWNSSLSHHLPIEKLPEFDLVYADLKGIINNIMQL